MFALIVAHSGTDWWDLHYFADDAIPVTTPAPTVHAAVPYTCNVTASCAPAAAGLTPSGASALIGNNSLISQDGAGVISNDGGSLISQDGSGLVSHDGGSLISQDGGSLISQDGGGIIGNGNAGIIGNGNAGIVGNIGQ